MTIEQKFWRYWIGGLVLFAVAIVLGLMITRNGVTLGIVEHQSAGTAERVNEIQTQWREAGKRGIALAAMLADLVFIGVYSLGSYFGGRMLMQNSRVFLRTLGGLIALAAVIFLITDYTETILQFIQLVRDQGEDWMAGTAATVRPVKVAAWIITFAGILLGLIIRRLTGSRA